MSSAMTHFWELTCPRGVVSACAIETGPKRMFALYELMKSEGYAVRVIDALEYEDLCDRLDAEGDAPPAAPSPGTRPGDEEGEGA